MFGNIINYTKSPGGNRRGLVYQSSTQKSFFTYDDYIGIARESNSGRYIMQIRFARNGDILLRIDLSSVSSTAYRINSYNLNDVWYPIAIIPLFTFKVGTNVIDMSLLPSYVTLDSQFLLEKASTTLTDYLGNTITRDFLILYYDIQNVPIYSNISYNIRSVETTPHDYKIGSFKQFIKPPTSLNLEYSTKVLYPTDGTTTYENVTTPTGSSLKIVRVNNFHDGDISIKGVISYIRETQSSQDYYVPSAEFSELRVKGNNNLIIHDYGTRGGGAFFFLGRYGISYTSYWFHKFNITTKTQDSYESLTPSIKRNVGDSVPITSPSGLWLGYGYAPAGTLFFDIFRQMTTILFTVDAYTNARYINEDILCANYGKSVTNPLTLNGFDEITPS